MKYRFAAEKPLGRLAKWLRMLGFDTLYEQDPGFVRSDASARGRIILTRRRHGRPIRPDVPQIVIHSDHYLEQLAELIAATGMKLESVQPFSRCIRCNRPIVSVDKAKLRGKVPDYVWETHETFKTCKNCRRIYWRGSHIEHSLERIRQLFAEKTARPKTADGMNTPG